MTTTLHSVSLWIDRLRNDDPQAAEAAAELWKRFFPRLAAVARRRLGAVSRGVLDQDDVALSAFAAFERAVRAGRFPDLRDRDGLWAMLATFTWRKAQQHLQHERRRGGGRVQGASALDREDVGEFGREAAPDEAVAFADSLESLLSALPGEEMPLIVLRKLAGHTNREISDLLDCSLATVERRLQMIRVTWKWLLEKDDAACVSFEAGWKQGNRPSIPEVLQEAVAVDRPILLKELLLVEWHYREKLRQPLDVVAYREQFTALAGAVETAWQRWLSNSTVSQSKESAQNTTSPRTQKQDEKNPGCR